MKYVEFGREKAPALGLGTWQIRGENCTKTVKSALELGYRNIDTAQMYGNEDKVGEGISRSGTDRKEIFLTTKIANDNHAHQDVLDSMAESLKRLRTDYVDLLLIHWPNKSVPLGETLKAMNELANEGKVLHLVVSNFSVEEMEKARGLSDEPVVCNQVEMHPFYRPEKVVKYCQEKGAIFTSYSPLGRGKVMDNEILRSIGEKHGKSASQVVLRWHVQKDNVMVIPKSASRQHQKENLDIFDFELAGQDMEKIDDMNRNDKIVVL